MAPISSTLLSIGSFHQTGFIQTPTIFIFSSLPPLFSFPIVTMDFLPSFLLLLNTLFFFILLTSIGHPFLFPPSCFRTQSITFFPALLFLGHVHSELNLLHRCLARLPLSLLCEGALTAMRGKERRK